MAMIIFGDYFSGRRNLNRRLDLSEVNDLVGETPCYVNFEGAISRSYAVDEDEKFLMSKSVVEQDLERFAGVLISNNHVYDDGSTGLEETEVFFFEKKKEVIGLSSDHEILGVADFFNV